MELVSIYDEEILKKIAKLSFLSACDPEGIENEVIKRLRIAISKMIGDLYRLP